MADYYKLVGSRNPTVDWTAEVILEKDDDGNVTKSVGRNRPAQLNQDDLDTLERLGYKVEKSSKSEAKAAEESVATQVSGDVAGSAPLIGDGTNPGESAKSTPKKS